MSLVGDGKRPFQELRNTMYAQDVTIGELAEYLCLSENAVRAKLAARTIWRLDEMYAILDYLDLPHEKMAFYFPLNGGVK